jgi:hypothetical protein
MKRLVCMLSVLVIGCAGVGDEAFSDIDSPCIGDFRPLQRHSTSIYRDTQERDSCSDGLWCNGEETYQGGVCVPGEPPCEGPCDEMHRHCAEECVFDSDCDDGLECTGQEWCCTWEKSDWGCEKYRCYPGPSPCGSPVWSVLTVCDCLWDEPCYDTCRSCRADHECDDGCWCNGEEWCGREGNQAGLCLHVVGSRPCQGDQVCDEENRHCNDPPECRQDSECGLEGWCDEYGKCHSW